MRHRNMCGGRHLIWGTEAMCVENCAAFLKSSHQDFKKSNMAAMQKISFYLSL
jgi:hypothetical protein